jgi:hypothetical protein
VEDDFKTLVDIKAQGKEDFVVFSAAEDLPAVKAAVQDMIKSAGIFDTEGSCHDEEGAYQRGLEMSNVKT